MLTSYIKHEGLTNSHEQNQTILEYLQCSLQSTPDDHQGHILENQGLGHCLKEIDFNFIQVAYITIIIKQ